ncbi:MAG: hypothetical protein JWR88_412 [Pseudonocardia sp.]|jgi:F0F1-type ATP synthase assembly protein I|nr:hypothetical protein [Pseudonocardia sp.]
MDGDGPGISDLVTMGIALAACLVVFFGLGWLVDLRLGTFPGFALVGLLVGIVVAGFYFYKQSKRFM